MMKKKSVISVVVLLVLVMPLFAQESNPESDFAVRLTDKGDGVVITGYTGEGNTVVIPSQIEGYPVVELGRGCFNYKKVTSVIIPNTVKKIAFIAFANSSITSLHLPASIELIEALAFNYCSNLESVTIDNPRLKVESISDKGTLVKDIFYKCSKLKEFNLPEGMVEIPPNLVVECKALTSVKIPDSTITIGSRAFNACALISITLPNGLQKIDGWAFEDNKITSITLPASIKEIGAKAFYGNRLTEVNIPESVSRISFPVFNYRSQAFGFSIDNLNLRSQAALKKVGYPD